MKQGNSVGLALAALATIAPAAADTTAVATPAPQLIAPGVWLIPGGIRPDRQPDGNSVVFEAPAGLVVVDTGRHAWHRAAILALARGQQRPIVAVVNTHWHLDHVSGNPDLHTAYPGLRVYGSNAIDGALSGFLATSARESAAYLDDPRIPATIREDIRADLLTIGNGAALKPDVVLGAAGAVTFGGRALWVGLAPDAVTAADVWLYDEASRVAVLGDLVTLPAPFLDTACPDGWMAALGQVAATPFEVAIPGHGAVMNRAQFELYRGAFAEFVACARSDRPQDQCASGWADAVAPLLADGAPGRQGAVETAGYYLGMLRANGGRSPYCAAAAGPGPTGGAAPGG